MIDNCVHFTVFVFFLSLTRKQERGKTIGKPMRWDDTVIQGQSKDSDPIKLSEF